MRSRHNRRHSRRSRRLSRRHSSETHTAQTSALSLGPASNTHVSCQLHVPLAGNAIANRFTCLLKCRRMPALLDAFSLRCLRLLLPPCGPEPLSFTAPLHVCVSFVPAAGWKALVRLASHAAVVVAEDFPVPPESAWLQQLARQLPLTVQLVAVDTACVLPMRLVPKCHEK